MRAGKFSRVLLALGTLLAVALPMLAAGQNRETKRGATLFRMHCASCHGGGGEGNGPVAEVLEIEPTDLTLLFQRIGGFSEPWLAEIIDGREEIRGHGSQHMPVWGSTFLLQTGPDGEADVQSMIDALVAYVLSLQQERSE